MKCMVCKTAQPVETVGDDVPFQYDVVCGECNENLEGVFNGDHPTFYAVMGMDYLVGLQIDMSRSDKQFIGTMKDLLDETTMYFEVACPCPRDETRWNTGEHTHL